MQMTFLCLFTCTTLISTSLLALALKCGRLTSGVLYKVQKKIVFSGDHVCPSVIVSVCLSVTYTISWKFGSGVPYGNLSSKHEFCENQDNDSDSKTEGCTFLTGIYEITFTCVP
jgi:hypothetical protein